MPSTLYRFFHSVSSFEDSKCGHSSGDSCNTRNEQVPAACIERGVKEGRSILTKVLSGSVFPCLWCQLIFLLLWWRMQGVRSKGNSTHGFMFKIQEILAYANGQYSFQRASGNQLTISIFGIDSPNTMFNCSICHINCFVIKSYSWSINTPC